MKRGGSTRRKTVRTTPSLSGGDFALKRVKTGRSRESEKGNLSKASFKREEELFEGEKATSSLRHVPLDVLSQKLLLKERASRGMSFDREGHTYQGKETSGSQPVRPLFVKKRKRGGFLV